MRGFFPSCTGKPQEIAMFCLCCKRKRKIERQKFREKERRREGKPATWYALGNDLVDSNINFIYISFFSKKIKNTHVYIVIN